MKSTSSIKYKIGLALIAISCIMPLCGFVIPFIGLSTAVTTVVTGIFLIGGPELIFFIGVFLAGKEAVKLVKQKLWKPAGKVRYMTGVVLFVVCIMTNWVCVYLELTRMFPLNHHGQLYLMATFDLLLIVSLFIMGPEFFIKFRSIFSWEGVQK
jgi:hypothetical protein